MKIETYSSTPGLERYPRTQRLATWHRAHKKLVRTDARYRNRYHSYLVGVICPVGLLPLLAATSPLWIMLSVLAVLGAAITVVFLAFAQQRYMNREIGRFLSLRTPEPQNG